VPRQNPVKKSNDLFAKKSNNHSETSAPWCLPYKYRLEIKIVAFRSDQHEIPISVESRFHLARKPQIVKSELS
jgi:hypothetical protein